MIRLQEEPIGPPAWRPAIQDDPHVIPAASLARHLLACGPRAARGLAQATRDRPDWAGDQAHLAYWDEVLRHIGAG